MIRQSQAEQNIIREAFDFEIQAIAWSIAHMRVTGVVDPTEGNLVPNIGHDPIDIADAKFERLSEIIRLRAALLGIPCPRPLEDARDAVNCELSRMLADEVAWYVADMAASPPSSQS